MKFIFNHTDENTAYLVDDYPYGFRLRTKIRYWIETTNRGDRICSQTLNPKTGNWNKPKKSTYSTVGVMFLDDNDHVKWTAFNSGWDNEEKINKFLDKIGGIDKLSEAQKQKVKLGIAISRTQEHIECELINTTYESDEQRAERKAEQEKIEENIQKIYKYHRYNLDQTEPSKT